MLKLSRDGSWRAACGMTIQSLGFHFEIREIARGVTAMVVGSGTFSALRSWLQSLNPPD